MKFLLMSLLKPAGTMTSRGKFGHYLTFIYLGVCVYIYILRGKESTEVRITQNKDKESENSYQKLKRSL